jgi:hypothetical protein
MKAEKLYYFAIARYIPDLLRNEPRNIGVLIFNESADEYRVRFTKNLRNKLGVGLLKGDREILSEYSNYYQSLQPVNKNEILNSIQHSKGKFLFSEIGSVVTSDINKEMEYLYTSFVEDKVEKGIIHRRLKTTLKADLIDRQFIGTNKLQVDKKIQVGPLEHKLDFTFENGKLYTIEAIDLTNTDRKENTYESAFKFENLIRARGIHKVETISVITRPEEPDDNVQELLKILNETSRVFNYSNGQRQALFEKIESIVH